MADIKLFDETQKIFRWKEIETYLIRSQYNEVLNFVLVEYERQYQPPYKLPAPNFRNNNFCLTLENCFEIYLSEENKKGAKPKVGSDEAELGNNPYTCRDDGDYRWRSLPAYRYLRKLSLQSTPKDTTFVRLDNGDVVDFKIDISSLTVGAVIWLYFYERMGIFKILGALMDDYNYRGKYTISGRRTTSNDYATLMDMICTLHRLGISSNLRDRICLYQRVLGVSIENNLGVESERNSGFMSTFNRLVDYTLEYYKAKQLAQAIQAQSSGAPQPRSSVATQTSIRDTINVLKQHFEPLQYGRNLINTFLGIANVHMTLCLVNMLKAEIGIPAQYERPEEFIPAAYDILVAKRTHSVTDANRFIVYDNCASYGYRLLTDIEMIDINALSTISTGSTLDVWLNDVEGLVEGYRNAYSAVPEKVEAIV
jgi:hypothetical protein